MITISLSSHRALNLVDFISRIFRLRDLHSDYFCFGFIVENNQEIFKALAIIDFIHPNSKDGIELYCESIFFNSK